MSFRYSYTATMKTGITHDANGNPVAGIEVRFLCDYQPTVSDTKIQYGGSFVNCKYKLFVPVGSDDGINVGKEVSCNGVSGIIVAKYPTKLNVELWVK